MKLQVKCDKCGTVGTSDEIATKYDGRDLCSRCDAVETLRLLKEDYAHKLAWLEATHLKYLRELKAKIDAAEAALQ